MVKRVIMLVGDFSEDMEVFSPLQAMQMLGIEVHAICPDKIKGDKIATAVHDFAEWQTYVESKGHCLALTATFDEVYQNYKEYDGLYIPGGRAPEYLRMNPKVLEIAKYFVESGKPVAAICHGPQILVAAGGLQGRKMTSYPAQECELRLCGVDFVKADADQVIVDGNLVTGPAWPANGPVTRKFVDLLGVKISWD